MEVLMEPATEAHDTMSPLRNEFGVEGVACLQCLGILGPFVAVRCCCFFFILRGYPDTSNVFFFFHAFYLAVSHQQSFLVFIPSGSEQ